MKKFKRISNIWKILGLRNTLQIIVYIFYDILICNVYVFTLIRNDNTIRRYATKRYSVIFQISCWCPILFHASFRNRQFYAKRPNKNNFFQILYRKEDRNEESLLFFNVQNFTTAINKETNNFKKFHMKRIKILYNNV